MARRAAAWLPISIALTLACVLGAAAQPAGPAQQPSSAPQGLSMDGDQPVRIESNTLEVRDKIRQATFAGDVKLTQGDTIIKCKVLVVFYEDTAAPSKKNTPPATAGAPPQKFVAAMPRQFRDPLPARAAQYQVARVQLVADRPISYADAEPWLTGPYRRIFLKRFQPRLADPEFRGPAMAKLQAYPEWQATLAPAEGQAKDKDKEKEKEKDKEKEKEKEKSKVEAPPKAAEKADSTWSWPFGKKK